jgi:hypothetical protein
MIAIISIELLVMILGFLSPEQHFIVAQASRYLYTCLKTYWKCTKHEYNGKFAWSPRHSAFCMSYALTDSHSLIEWTKRTGQLTNHYLCTVLAFRNFPDELEQHLPSDVSKDRLVHYKLTAANVASFHSLRLLLSPKYREIGDGHVIGRCAIAKLPSVNRNFTSTHNWQLDTQAQLPDINYKDETMQMLLSMCRDKTLELTPRTLIEAMANCCTRTGDVKYIMQLHALVETHQFMDVYGDSTLCQSVMRNDVVNIPVMQHFINMFVITNRRTQSADVVDRKMQLLFRVMISFAAFCNHIEAAKILCLYPMEYATTTLLYICCIAGQPLIFDLCWKTATPAEIKTMFLLAIDCHHQHMVIHLRRRLIEQPGLDCLLARAGMYSALRYTTPSLKCMKIMTDANKTMQSPDSLSKKTIATILQQVPEEFISRLTPYITIYLKNRDFL